MKLSQFYRTLKYVSKRNEMCFTFRSRHFGILKLLVRWIEIELDTDVPVVVVVGGNTLHCYGSRRQMQFTVCDIFLPKFSALAVIIYSVIESHQRRHLFLLTQATHIYTVNHNLNSCLGPKTKGPVNNHTATMIIMTNWSSYLSWSNSSVNQMQVHCNKRATK